MKKEPVRFFLTRHLPDFALLTYLIAMTVGVFAGAFWFTLVGSFTLFFAFSTWYIDRELPLPEKSLAILALGFFVVSGCLNFRSFFPDVSWQEWIKLVTIFLPFCFLLSPRVASRLLHPKHFLLLPFVATLSGLGLAVLLHIKAQGLTPREIELTLPHYNRGFSYLMLMSFPIMASLWFSKRRWLIVPFFLLLLIPASFTESRSSKLALLLAMFVIFVAHWLPVLTRRLLACTPFIALAWPFAAQQFFLTHFDWLNYIPKSFRARVEIWDYMSYRVMEQPWLGWGLGTSSSLPFQEPHGAMYIYTLTAAAHPHNVMIELWVELGVPGLILGICFALLTLYKASRLDARIAPFALGAWVAGFCLCLVAYNFWTDSLFACFALTSLAFLLLQQKLRQSQPFEAVPANHESSDQYRRYG